MKKLKSIFKLMILLSIVNFQHLRAHSDSECATGPKKNVILIIVDDMNDWVNPFGGYDENISITPNIESLANRGVTFYNAHCNFPLCGPSRASFMTGRLPTATTVYDNSGEFRHFVPDIVTMPQHFKNQGYDTYASGKVFHNAAGNKTIPKETSDPVSWTEQRRGNLGTSYPTDENRRKTGLDYTVLAKPNQAFDYFALEDTTLESTHDWKTADYCANILEERSNEYNANENATVKPFFIACGVYRPHIPLFAPKQYFDKFPLSSIKLPKLKPEGAANNYRDLDDIEGLPSYTSGLHNEILKHSTAQNDIWKKFTQAYLASLNFADDCVGHLLNSLDNSHPNIKNNTIVVLMGDHGWALGEKESWKKHNLWEEQTKTPLIIYDPSINNTAANQGKKVTQKAVSLVDIFPTLIDLSNVCRTISPKGKLNKLDGKSLRPLLEDPNSKWNHSVLITNGEEDHAIRTSRYRYIARDYDNSSKRTEELYDHKKDPNEFNNLLSGTPSEWIVTLRNKLRVVMNNKIVNSQKNSPVNVNTSVAKKLILTLDGEFDDERTVLYPTVVTNFANLKLAQSIQGKATNIVVYNINGVKVDNVSVSNLSTVQFSTNEYVSGQYFLQVLTQDSNVLKTIRFIKE